MKQLNSILSMLLMFMFVFTSCGESTDPKGDDPFADTKDHGFKTANITSVISYSDDFLNLVNVTCTYTDMEGKTDEVKLVPGSANTLELNFSSSTLPASFKIDVKVEKNENYDAYLESKETFDLSWSLYPSYIAGWVEQCEAENVLDNNSLNGYKNIEGAEREAIKEAFDDLMSIANFSFSGTFEKNGNGVRFNSDLK